MDILQAGWHHFLVPLPCVPIDNFNSMAKECIFIIKIQVLNYDALFKLLGQPNHHKVLDFENLRQVK